MSKRVAGGQDGSERYGGMKDARNTATHPPRKATVGKVQASEAAATSDTVTNS